MVMTIIMQAISFIQENPATYGSGQEWHGAFTLITVPAPALQLTKRPFKVRHHLQLHILTLSAPSRMLTRQVLKLNRFAVATRLCKAGAKLCRWPVPLQLASNPTYPCSGRLGLLSSA